MSVSSTVPIPPGTTTKTSEAITKWCRRLKNVLCSKASWTKGFISCSNGRSTRMPMERCGAPALAAPSLAACMRPGPPPVTISHSIAAQAAATRLTSS